MIKHFAKPFNVVYRTENSINKKIESIEDQIEFEKYKLQNKAIVVDIFTKVKKDEERLRKLEQELDYYQEILDLKYNNDYIDGLIGGELLYAGSLALGVALGLISKQLRK